MAGDIYISFGADTAELEASLAVAKAQVNSLASDFRDLTDQFVESGASIDSDLGQQMVALGGKMNQAKGHVVALKEELKGVGEKGEGEEERLSLFERMKESAEAVVSPINALKGSLSELVEIFAAAFAVERVVEWASETTEAMERIEREAAKLGVSSEKVESLMGVAAMSGTNYDEMATQLEHLQLSLAKVGEKSTPAAEALRVLGLNAAQLRNLPIDEQMDRIAESFSKFADGPTKTAAAIALLGRAGADLIPVLDKGKDGLEELRGAAERAGAITPGDLVATMAKTSEVIKELSQSWNNLLTSVFVPFNTAVRGAVRVLADLFESLQASAASGGLLRLAFAALALSLKVTAEAAALLIAALGDMIVVAKGAAQGVGQAFVNMGEVARDVFVSLGEAIPAFFRALLEAGVEAVKGLGAQFSDLGTVIGDAMKGNFAGARAAFAGMGGDAEASLARIGGAFKGVFDFSAAESDAKAGMAKIDAIVKDTFDGIKRNGQNLVNETHAIWGLDADKEKARPPGGAVPAMNLAKGGGASSSHEAAQAVRDAYDAEVRAAKDAADEEQEVLKRKLDFHQITTKEWAAQSIAALDREQDAIQDAAEKAMASDELSAHEKSRIALQEAQEIAQIAKKIAEDQDKAAKDTQKSWDQAFNAINGAFDSQISGLLRGTTSWAQAFKNVLATLTEDVIKFFVNWGLKAGEQFIEEQVMNTTRVTAHVAGNATMAASDAASASAGGLAWVGAALKTLSADAAAVFGGVFGFLAPALGPAAAGPATAASASVLSGAGAIASADIGMWQVPGDMLSLVHHNELIMPAGQADAFRSMLTNAAAGGGGGGDTTHNHTWNITSNSADARDVAKQVASLWNRTPSMRPAY